MTRKPIDWGAVRNGNPAISKGADNVWNQTADENKAIYQNLALEIQNDRLKQEIIKKPETNCSSKTPPGANGHANGSTVEIGTAGRAQAHWNNEPWHAPVSTAELLNEIRKTLLRFLVLPKHADIIIPLWILHAWALPCFDVSPFLVVVSPVKQCGKTTLLITLQWLTPRSVLAGNLSESVLFRFIEMHEPTMIVDEADTFVKYNNELRGVLNGGHTRPAAVVWRSVETKGEYIPTPFSTWCPKVIASIGALADTLMDRGFIIRLRRKKKSEERERRPLRDCEAFKDLRSKCARWAQDHRERLDGNVPDLPDELYNRVGDNCESLLAIAELAGQSWWDAAIEAFKADDDPSEHGDAKVDLLFDIYRIFKKHKNQDWFGAKVLAEKLANLEDAPWGAWGKFEKQIHTRTVSSMLSAFQIHSIEGRDCNRYERRQFYDAWEEYLGLKWGEG